MFKLSDSGSIITSAGIVYWLSARQNEYDSDDKKPDWLGETEFAYWTQLKSTKRRRDWLLGRWSAKQLLGQMVGETTGRRLRPDTIEILRHPDGWPQVRIEGLTDPSATYSLSISHSHDQAFVAAVTGDSHLLGVDIEFVEPRPPGFAADYFTGEEMSFLAAAPDSQQVVLITAIWSGKEAALKAIRRGLAEDTRIVSCIPALNGDPSWRQMPVMWSRPAERPALTGWWRTMGDYVMTLVVGARVLAP